MNATKCEKTSEREEGERGTRRKEVAFKKNVLENFLNTICKAYEKCDKELERLDRERPELDLAKKLSLMPNLHIEVMPGEGMRFIIESLKRAINRETDPFKLRLPRGGNSELTELDRFDIAVDTYRLWKQQGKSKEDACAEIAEKYSLETSTISSDTVKNVINNYAKKFGERLLDDGFCDAQVELFGLLEITETHYSSCALRTEKSHVMNKNYTISGQEGIKEAT